MSDLSVLPTTSQETLQASSQAKTFVIHLEKTDASTAKKPSQTFRYSWCKLIVLIIGLLALIGGSIGYYYATKQPTTFAQTLEVESRKPEIIAMWKKPHSKKSGGKKSGGKKSWKKPKQYKGPAPTYEYSAGSGKSVKVTWYDPLTGGGACTGKRHGGQEMVIAVAPSFGAKCGQGVLLKSNGRECRVTVVDRCMGCNAYHIDATPGVWTCLGIALSIGEIKVDAELL
jgi:hypothetical protein